MSPHMKSTGFLGLGAGLHVCDICYNEFEHNSKAWKCEKDHFMRFSPKELFDRLDSHINTVRSNASTTTEQVVVGHKKVDLGIWGDTTQAQYGTRTRDVPEYQVEEAVAKSLPGQAEQEIIRRGKHLLPNLVGKYRSGKNIAIIKRILEKMPSKDVGLEFKKYEMFEEAEKWFSSHELFDEAKKVRSKLRVNQTVVQGDYVDDRDTVVKDSVLNRSKIGGGSSKMQELKELTDLKREGLIDDDEFKQMKKEILGK